MRMAQNCNREYWQQLINKYSERTGELQHKQQELLIRTETLQKLIGNCNADKLLLPTPPPATTTHDDDISSVYSKINLSSLVGNQCKCPPERQQPTGLFQCLFRAIFPNKNPERLTVVEPKVEEAQISAPPPSVTTTIATTTMTTTTTVSPIREKSTTTTTVSPIRERSSTTSECLCVPPIAKLSDSSDDCICSIKSSSSSNNKLKESNNKSKESNNATVEPLQEYKIETNNDNNNKCDLISLKSEDLSLIQKLEGLLVEQKTLNKQINELEQKERVYKELLKEHPINENNQQFVSCKCLDKNTINDNNNNNNNNKQQLCELKLENLLLKNELKDLKLEIRQYLERIEGPMQFKIESERYKCIKLEEQLEQQRKEFYEQQQLYKNEINTLNIQLMNTNTNLYELNKANEELLLIKQQLELKVKQLEDDLIRQKLSDFETIKCLTVALEESNKPTSTEQKESCNLNEIAMELSRTLKEIGPCGECSRLPSDIKVTAEYIKELAMLMQNKLPPPPPPSDRVQEVVAETPPPPPPPGERLQEVVAEAPLPPPPLQESSPSINEAEDYLEEIVESTSEASPEQIVVVETITGAEQTVNSSGNNSNRNDDDIVVVMPENDIKSQSSKSLNQVETIDGNYIKLPTPPTQSPIIVEEKSTSKKKCQCSRRRLPTTTTTDQPAPTVKECKQSVEKSTTGRKCQCSRREPTTTDQPPTIKEESIKQEEIVGDVQATITTPPSPPPPPTTIIDEENVEQQEPPTTLRKPCKCAAMKQIMDQLNNVNTADREVPVASEVEEIVPAASEVEEIVPPSSTSPSDKNENVVENFPLPIDRQVEILDEPPGKNVHVIAVITRSGMLDVVTKGPEGHVQTTLRYNPSGNIEVTTEIFSNENNYQQTNPQIQSLQSNEQFINDDDAEELLEQGPQIQSNKECNNDDAEKLLEQELLEIEEAMAEIQEQGEESDGDEKE